MSASPRSTWPEDTAPLAGLGLRFGLSRSQLSQLRVLACALAFEPGAPTAVRDPLRVRDDHLADALVVLALDWVQGPVSLADLGAGAGVPGLPLAVALPLGRVTLLEANARKCRFLERLALAMGLSNVSVVNARAEEWRAGASSLDVVTARAVGPLDVVAEYAAPLLRPGGALIAWRGQRDDGIEAAGARAAQLLGLVPEEPLRVEPYPTAANRHLHVFRKVRATPVRFPRRSGVAHKRPLGTLASA